MTPEQARNAANRGLMCIRKTDAGDFESCWVETVLEVRSKQVACVRKLNGKKAYVELEGLSVVDGVVA